MEKLQPENQESIDIHHLGASRLVREIARRGLASLPFDINPNDIAAGRLNPDSAQETDATSEDILVAEALPEHDTSLEFSTADQHIIAKIAMEMKGPVRHKLGIWYDEMPGNVTKDLKGVDHYDNKAPVFHVRRNRVDEPPRLLSKRLLSQKETS